MTQRMIYNDFRSGTEAPGAVLTAPVLRKGRRVLKTFARIHRGVNMGCVFLCGACSAVSLLILLLLAHSL